MMISCTVVVRVKSQMMRATPSTYTRRSILAHRELLYSKVKKKKLEREREREKEQNIYHKFHNQLIVVMVVVVVAAERTEREKGKRLAFEQIKGKKQNQIGVSEYTI